MVPILRAGDNGKAWGAIAHINKMEVSIQTHSPANTINKPPEYILTVVGVLGSVIQASTHVMGGILPLPKFNYVPKALGCMKDMASSISLSIENIEGLVGGNIDKTERKPKNPLAILLERIKVRVLLRVVGFGFHPSSFTPCDSMPSGAC